MNETPVQQRIRLDAARYKSNLWRNNVGVLKNEDGVPVRYGLANDSPKVNRIIKSSDLIGPTPVFITPEMVGRVIAVFTAIETKKTDWIFDLADERTNAQNNFHNIVRAAGGFAGFARSVEEYRQIIGRG